VVARIVSTGIPILTVLAAIACGDTAPVTEITGPGIVRCQVSLSAPPSTVPPTGTIVSVAVEAARECAWTAAAEAEWISVSPVVPDKVREH